MNKRTLYIIIGCAVGLMLLACLSCLAFNMISSSSPTSKATLTVSVTQAVTEITKVPNTLLPIVTNMPSSTKTSTPVPIGMSRNNPVPSGQPVLCDDNLEFTVLKVERGQLAWNKIYGYNMLNSKPAAGMEYVLITVKVKFIGDSDKTKIMSSSYFRVVGDRGEIYTVPFVVLGKDLGTAELFGGGTTEGELAFRVVQDEKSLVLIYSGGNQKARFLSFGQ